MTYKEDWLLFPIAFQSGEDASSTRGRFEDLTGNRFPIEDSFEKSRPFNLIARRVDGVDPDILLKIFCRLIQNLVPVHEEFLSSIVE